MGTVITGSAGGIGAATRARLEERGERVIGVDVRDAEVIADLSSAAGREAMVAGVAHACGGVLDGLVAGAGIAGGPGELVGAVNWFGALATLEGLRPMLARGTAPAAVAISSNSTTCQPHSAELVDAFLAGDEEAALALAARDATGIGVYPATKLALARWVRRHAVQSDWIGAGIRLNAVAPGLIHTPMTADGIDFVLSLGDTYPVPVDRAGLASEVAALIDLLLGADGGFFCGSVVLMDGGTEAALRPDDWPLAPS
jgi:NAD(P)-dependent dehydrogenase (short-subunit alcohol dehydrogenase family)